MLHCINKHIVFDLINTYLISETEIMNQLFELTARFFQEWDYFLSVDLTFTTTKLLIDANEPHVHSGRAPKRKECWGF